MTKFRLNAEQIFQLKQKGISQKDLATIFEVTQQTITRWKKQKKPAPRERKRKPKDYGNIPELLKTYIYKHNTATQNEMAIHVSIETNQSISQQKVSRTLRKNGVTRKKLTFHYTQLNEEKAKALN